MKTTDPLPRVLLDAFAKGSVEDAAHNPLPLDANVSPSEARLLYDAVRKLNVERSVEVGLAKGVSALAILKALEDSGRGTHTVIDPFQQDYGDCGLAMIERAGLSHRMQFRREFPEAVIPTLEPVDFAFIDASHLFDLTLMEFVLVDKILRVGGVVGFHDMWMREQRKLIRYILRNRRYSIWPKPRRPMLSTLCATVRQLPLTEKFFSQEFLRPYQALGAGNLILLRKDADDQGRHWRDFKQF